MKKYTIFLILAIAGCTSNIPKTANFSAYVNQVEYREHKSEMHHKEHGNKFMYEEPILSVHKNCIVKSYQGYSAKLPSIEVTDPILLYEMRRDWIVHRMMIKLGFHHAPDPVKGNQYAVMKNPEFIKAMNALEIPEKNFEICFKESGWSYTEKTQRTKDSN